MTQENKKENMEWEERQVFVCDFESGEILCSGQLSSGDREFFKFFLQQERQKAVEEERERLREEIAPTMLDHSEKCIGCKQGVCPHMIADLLKILEEKE